MTSADGRCKIEVVDKSIKRYSSLAEMKADEYRAWAALPARQRLQATADLSTETYRLKGVITDVPRLQRTLVRLQRSPR